MRPGVGDGLRIYFVFITSHTQWLAIKWVRNRWADPSAMTILRNYRKNTVEKMKTIDHEEGNVCTIHKRLAQETNLYVAVAYHSGKNIDGVDLKEGSITRNLFSVSNFLNKRKVCVSSAGQPAWKREFCTFDVWAWSSQPASVYERVPMRPKRMERMVIECLFWIGRRPAGQA